MKVSQCLRIIPMKARVATVRRHGLAHRRGPAEANLIIGVSRVFDVS